jgi:uncharacterized Zn-binding protein involved in type VI secretion
MSYLDNLKLAVDQKSSGVTGDKASSWTRVKNTPGEMGAVFSDYGAKVKGVADHPLLKNPDGTAKPFSSLSGGQQAAVAIRVAANVVGLVSGAFSVAQDALNVGFANLTAPLAAIYPSFPACTLTSMWFGSPHTHTHPPSLIPPAPPIPLPSIGMMAVGNCVRVLIGSLPAARLGDIGVAPTCCGFTPFFSLFLGSSNVFIGGKRAARMLDMGFVCAPPPPPPATKVTSSKALAAAGKAAGAVLAAMPAIGVVGGALGIAADVADAAVEDDAAMAAGKALSAAMNSAQMAMDAAAMAMEKAMGKDPAGIPPKPPGMMTLGFPMVLIGGFPMINIPNPAEVLLKKLSAYKLKGADQPGGKAGADPCP